MRQATTPGVLTTALAVMLVLALPGDRPAQQSAPHRDEALGESAVARTAVVAPEAPLVVPAGHAMAGRPAAAHVAPHSLAAASAYDIPAAALAAYQRAETVLAAADPSCHLPWELLAAIGRVESDHGRFGPSTLAADGRATPAIVGRQLDGRAGTARITDSDAGRLDRDTRFDRAIGPMQFIPTTWSVVGIDADADGRRDPQDIDDAALAAGVYLCGGAEDLSTRAGQRAAVLRYNNSTAYVRLVLTLYDAYRSSEVFSVQLVGVAVDLSQAAQAAVHAAGRGDGAPPSRPAAARTTAEPAGSATSATPATQPPATQPPATQPPPAEQPTTEPPATEPPATEPPPTEQPGAEGPTTEEPAPDGRDACPQPSEPAAEPTSEPTAEPTTEPTAEPTAEPTTEPSEPTAEPAPTDGECPTDPECSATDEAHTTTPEDCATREPSS